MSFLAWVYRRALSALPPAARERDGEELERLFGEVVRDARARRGRTAGHLRAAREIADLLVVGLRARWSRKPMQRAEAPAPPPGKPRRRRPALRPLLHDVRFAARALARRRGYTALAMVTLGLGIGAATTLFGVVDHVLLRPLPYPEADRLVMVWRVVERYGFDRAPVSYPDYSDWRASSHAFSHLAAFTSAQATLLGEGDPELLRGARVSGDLFATLGRRPLLGRLIGPADDDPAAPPVAVISEGLWHARFGADPEVVGRAIRLDESSVQVVGVAPADLDFPSPATDYWTPLRVSAATAERDMNFLQVVGRLAPGIGLAGAEREIRVVAERVAAEHPGENELDGLWLEPRLEFLVGDVRPVLWVLLAAVGALLVLACANVMSLLLARSFERRRELALRSALGAGSGRLGSAVVTESLLLAAGGGVLAVAVAQAATRLLVAFDPVGLARRETLAVDPRVLLAALALTLVSGLVCGLVPLAGGALRAPAELLAAGGRATGDRRGGRLQSALVAAQVTVATILLVGAGLLGHSLYRLATVAPGFDGGRVLTARVSPAPASVPDPEAIDRFYAQLLERIDAIPGVEAAGGTWAMPFSNVPASWGGPTSASSTFAPAGAADGEEGTLVTLEPVRGDYFRALGMTVLAGRTFTPADRFGAPTVAVVNQTLARRFWPDRDAVGKRMIKAGSPGREVTVVGVVADVKRTGLDQAPEPVAYLPHRQAIWSQSLFLTVRASGEPAGLSRALQRQVWALDPDAVVSGVAVLSDLVSDSVATPRLRTAVFAGLAGTAAALALVGIYGVLAFTLARRSREVAVRLALGAGRRRVTEEMVVRGLGPALLGLALGTAGAVVATRALGAFLFEVRPLDPVTFVAVPLLLFAASALACWMPARRAAAADPVEVLREG